MHKAARFVWDELLKNHFVDDAYYAKVIPTLDRQRRRGGASTCGFP